MALNINNMKNSYKDIFFKENKKNFTNYELQQWIESFIKDLQVSPTWSNNIQIIIQPKSFPKTLYSGSQTPVQTAAIISGYFMKYVMGFKFVCTAPPPPFVPAPPTTVLINPASVTAAKALLQTSLTQIFSVPCDTRSAEKIFPAEMSKAFLTAFKACGVTITTFIPGTPPIPTPIPLLNFI